MDKKKLALYLDDVRTPIETMEGYEPWAVVRNFEEFVAWVEKNGIPHYVSLDHDLADQHMHDYYKNQANGVKEIHYNTFTEKTGVDCLAFLLNCVFIDLMEDQNTNLEVIGIHSHNPVGSQNMHGLAMSFIKHQPWKGVVHYARPKFIIEEQIEP